MKVITLCCAASALLAGCGIDGVDTAAPATETAAQLSFPVACAFDSSGWGVKLQGTDPDPNVNINDEATTIATDTTECAIYTGGGTVGALEDQVKSGGRDAYVTRWSTRGRVAWTRQFGSTAADDVSGVAVGPNHDIYVTGCTWGQITNAPEANAGGSDAFLAKYDKNGNQLWVHQMGSAGDDCSNGVAVGISGGVFITGVARGTLAGVGPYFGSGDAFIVKYSSAGVRQFTKMIGSPLADESNDIAIAPDGKLYIVGYTQEDLHSFTNPGLPSPGRFGADDIFIAKYDPVTGAELWLDQRGTSWDERGNAIAVNANNEVFATGYTEGPLDGQIGSAADDIFVLSYTTAGAWRWTDVVGSIAQDQGYGIAVDANGAPFVVGHAYDNIGTAPHAGSGDVVVTKYSRAGSQRWLFEYGESDTERANDAAFFGDQIFVTGHTNSDLGGAQNNGGNDAFIIELDGAGTQL